MSFQVPERFRFTAGVAELYSSTGDGNNGCFQFTSPIDPSWALFAIASDEGGWEHVSVRAIQRAAKRDRLPSWGEMAYVKDLFWGLEDAVMQLHPRRSQYVNCHPCVLHLWRPTDQPLPEPPAWMVGPR